MNFMFHIRQNILLSNHTVSKLTMRQNHKYVVIAILYTGNFSLSHNAQVLAVECLKWREIAKNEKNIYI